MLVDLVVNPFGADVQQMVDMARAADEGGFGCVWVTDHFSGAVVDAPWSRDPFVCLGALAGATQQVDVGLLVANVTNRHPVQLASAINSLQSLAPGRVRLGVGSGAAPGSRFAAEHDMIGKRLGDVTARRELLRDSIGALRAIWAGQQRFAGSGGGSAAADFAQLAGVTDGAAMPHLIVGASAWQTIEVALEIADGVNIRRTSALGEQLTRLSAVRPPGFEVSVLDFYDPNAPDALLDSSDGMVAMRSAGVDRLIVTTWPARDVDSIRRIGAARAASAR